MRLNSVPCCLGQAWLQSCTDFIYPLLIICCIGLNKSSAAWRACTLRVSCSGNLWPGPVHSFLLGACHGVGAGRKSKALSIWHSYRREIAIPPLAAMANHRDLGMCGSPEQWTGNGNPLLLCSLRQLWDVQSPLKHPSRAAAWEGWNSGLLLAGILQFVCKYPWYTSTPQYYLDLFAWEVDWKGMWFHWGFLL